MTAVPNRRPRATVRARRLVGVTAVAVSLAVVSACASSVQGTPAGNTRLNTATTQASVPLNSSAVLTPQTSPQQQSGGESPGATAAPPPSPDVDQTTALRARLATIDPALDTDRAVARSVAVCTEILSGSDPLTVAAAVRGQFGADLGSGTATAIVNVITNTFCQR